ncbi:MAG: HNH endonuclease [Alphaproteobacteria bacterium]|nr:HNH endonuclease [Alphaproteobacteria bacterium]
MAYWWLNQKEDDFAILDDEGLVAVPRRDKLGKTHPGYAVCADMRPGDIGFAFVGGEFDGVFAVVGQPEDDAIEMAPDFRRRAARMVPVRFFDLAAPIAVEEMALRLRNVLPAVGSPLDADSAGKDTTICRLASDVAERLITIAADADPMSASIGEAMAEAISVGDLPEETKNDLIEARLGFGRFSDAVRALWDGACCATGVSVDMLVHVCPIKPWVRATNDERLDPENGLPLVPTWNFAFVSGLIAFNDDGDLLLSAELPADEARKAGIAPDLRLAIKGERQRAYLAWHRANVFVAG